MSHNRRREDRDRRYQRDANDITTKRNLRVDEILRSRVPVIERAASRVVEEMPDLRRYTPNRIIERFKKNTRQELSNNRLVSNVLRVHALDARELRREKICSSRHERKRVLFATNKAGNGGGKRREPRYTEDSKIKCR